MKEKGSGWMMPMAGTAASAIVAAVHGLMPLTAPPLPRQRRAQPSCGKVWLHPTKGWRGDGVKPRGTNKRRTR